MALGKSIASNPSPSLLCLLFYALTKQQGIVCAFLSLIPSQIRERNPYESSNAYQIPLPRLHNQSPTQCKTQSITKRAGLSRESCFCRARSSQPTTLDQLPCFNPQSSMHLPLLCIHSLSLCTRLFLGPFGSDAQPTLRNSSVYPLCANPDPLLLLSLLILEARVLRRILYSCYPSFTLTCRILFLVLSTNLIACALTAVVLTLGWRERECFYRAIFASRSCRERGV